MFNGMHERNFDTSFENFGLANALHLWKKWPDSDVSTENLSRLLTETLRREPLEIKIRKEVLNGTGPSKFRMRQQALDYGRLDGRYLVFDLKSEGETGNVGRKLKARVDKINGESFLILETPADKPFGFLRPEDVVSIRI